ncbi:hypothetical protein HDV00_006749 [Rhizophlyctis rosea]|nr:hypothetical protein HDV00_006749 [Rhizophlyctis rosea]
MSLEELNENELEALHRDLSHLIDRDLSSHPTTAGTTADHSPERRSHDEHLDDYEDDENALLQAEPASDGDDDSFSAGTPSFDFDNVHAFPLASTLSKSETELAPNVSLWSGIALIIGMSIGSGIFASPGPVFSHAGSVGAALVVWVVAGLLAITGALSYAELGSMIPTSGGEHPYLMRAYGSLPAFLFSWTGTTVTRPGSVAIITVIFAEYVCRLIYFAHPVGTTPAWLVKLIATVCIISLTAVNALSTKLGTAVQDVFTVLKLASLLVIGGIGVMRLVTGQSTSHNYDHSLFAGSSTNGGDWALALYSALWAYDGWNTLNLVTGELKDSKTNLPKAIVAGPSIIIFCYLMANVAYYAVLPAEIVGKSTTIAMDFGKEVFGSIGGIIIPLIVIGSTFGAANASIFGGARVMWVSARHGHIPEFLGSIHPKRKTPVNALILQACLSVLFVMVGSFTSLVNFYSMIAWSFYLLAVLALLILRRSEPHAERPYRVWVGVPVVFCAVTIFLISFSVREAPGAAVGAALFMLSGVPLWYVVVRREVKWEGGQGTNDNDISAPRPPTSPTTFNIKTLKNDTDNSTKT